MSLRRRAVLLAAVGVAASGASKAHAANAAAAAPIEALDQGLLAVMKAGTSTPFRQRFDMLAPIVDRTFDLPHILAVSVGPRMTGLPPAQQTALLDQFRRFTVASYVANFDSPGDRIEVTGEQRPVGSDLVVATHIVPSHGEPVSIDYVMRQGAQGWRAIDVLLNGSISQNAVKRSDFRSLVSSASAQPLIDSLRRKVSELSGGALS